MKNKHYHVLLTMPGYMPDANDRCDTIREAEDQLRFWRDQELSQENGKVYGSIRNHRISFPNGQIAYVTDACYEDCDHD